MISGIIARMRSLWRGARRRSDVESEMNEEFRLHVEMRAQDLVRSGHSPAEAVRQARREFGSTERYKGEARASRGLHYFDRLRFSWLDFKLGARMLVRHSGVTIVGGLAMVIGIGLGAGYLEVVNDFIHPSLPFDEGERIVGLQNWDVEENDPELLSIHDFVAWHDQLRSIDDLSAFRSIERNIGAIGGPVEPSRGAQISPSAFKIVHVPALLGRTLIDADEQQRGPPVVVLGYQLWRSRFLKDPDVIGRTVQLGSAMTTVVGVMPKGFAFPVNHQFWVPLRANAFAFGPRQARIELDVERPDADSAARAEFFAEFQAKYEELERRLQAEPGISRVTFATHLPGMDHPQPWVEVDSAEGSRTEAHWVMTASVEVDFFDAFGAEIVAGRGFNSADVGATPRVVVVNDHFVNVMLDGRNAVGRRVRYRSREPGPWYEIVGVVHDLGMDTGNDAFFPGWGPGMYKPLTPDAMAPGVAWVLGRRAGSGFYSVRVAFHVHGDAASFAPRLREMARDIDPALRLYDVLPLDGPVDKANQAQRWIARFSTSMTALVALIALLISTAGVYAMLSFTVACQTREIGIRVALGADRRHIITQVFSRTMLQIGVGILVGALLWFFVVVRHVGGGDDVGLLLMTALVVMLLGLIACGVPVHRALQVEPIEALKEVGWPGASTRPRRDQKDAMHPP